MFTECSLGLSPFIRWSFNLTMTYRPSDASIFTQGNGWLEVTQPVSERWTQTASPGLSKAACTTAQAKERKCPGLQGGRPGGGGSHTPLKMGRQRRGAGAGICHGEEGELPAREGVAQGRGSGQGPAT